MDTHPHPSFPLAAAARLLTALLLVGIPLRPAAAADAPSTDCQIHITVKPADAIISFDGMITNLSPATIPNIKPGEHLLIVQKQGYREVRRTITLSPGQKLPIQLTLEPLMGLLIIHSDPSDADVQIEGAHRGKTPLLLTDLPLGKYRMKLIKAGFQPTDIDLPLENRTPRKIVVPLNSDSASLSITSEPEGASVKVNGLDKGTTPCLVDRIPQGSANVEVTLNGFEPYADNVKLVAGDKQTLKVALKPIPAELTVVSIPAKARIYVNNEFKGEAPVTLQNLPPGTYRLRGELPDHEPVAYSVDLKRAEKATKEIRLEGNVGSILITTDPAEVTIMIDGKQAGVTPLRKEAGAQGSDPLQIDNIRIGKREILFSRKRCADVSRSVEIEKGKTLTLHQTLKRQFTPDYEVRTPSGLFRGELVWVHSGSVKLEIAPGVFKVIPADQVRSKRPLAGPEAD